MKQQQQQQQQQNHRIKTANGTYIHFTVQFFAYQSAFSLCTCIKIMP